MYRTRVTTPNGRPTRALIFAADRSCLVASAARWKFSALILRRFITEMGSSRRRPMPAVNTMSPTSANGARVSPACERMVVT